MKACRHRSCLACDPARGFSLLEIVIALTFFAVALLGISSGLFQGVKTTGELRRQQMVKSQAQIYLNRLMSLNFGQSTDPIPTSSQLSELFDEDNMVGNVTLMSLSKYPAGDGGWLFEREEFPVCGKWLVTVNQDLDGDDVVHGELEESGLLLRIQVMFSGDVILSTIRGKETQT